MTIPEACQLVLQAGAIGRPRDVLILDMGEPVKILDIANRMIEISGKRIEIVFTGLRPGEKLHEDLYGMKEDSEVLTHELISQAKVEPINPKDLDRSLLS
jgi:dTDP-glucose 4,6-dehydratase